MRSVPIAILLVLASAGSASAQRLPGDVVPVHYDLTVAPDLAAAKFTGAETIRLRLAKPSSTIVLNAAEITFKEVRVTAGGKTQTASVVLDPQKEQAVFRVPAPIPAGEASVDIRYEGILNDDLRGLYLSRANNRRYAVTQLEATDARRMFPSFDEPAFKATFALTAIIDAADRAISNGAVTSDTPGPDPGKHTVKFDTTPKMSTYLVALTVGDFDCNEGSADGIPVRICATPDKKHLTAFALEAAQQQIEFLNRYYSIRYPFKKLDVVAVPDFAAGAMENTAAIFYRETLLLAEPDASVEARKNIAKVLAHEIAHQWFGNIVTMQWWEDIWLNEGFANWMMSKPVKAWRPDWHLELDEVEENHVAMGLDALRSTRSIRAKATTPAEIAELFDPIAYEKGAAVIRMLESWLGEEPFRKGVNAYIEKYQYANARAEDFWGTLTKVTGKPVDRVMSTFVDQPGLPLVSIDVRCTGAMSQAILSQDRYLRDPAGPPPAPRQPWQIPVCLKSSSGETTCDVLREKQEPIALKSCPDWVMGNAGARGYYRVASSPEWVKKLAANLGALTAQERMVVLSDELAMVRAGRHDVGTLLDLASGFGKEQSAAVMETLTSILAAVGEDFVGPETRTRFRSWAIQLLGPVLERQPFATATRTGDTVSTGIGLSPAPGVTDETKAFLRAVVSFLGETARHPAVLAQAENEVRRELDKPASIDATMREVLLNIAAFRGDAALYDRYLARSKAATEPEERYQYLYALTAFGDPALVRRTMDLTLSPDVRSQDVKFVIARMLANADSQRLAWQLTRERWPEIQKKTGEFVGNTVIVGALSSFCEARAAAEVRAFFAKNPVPDAERTLLQSLERITSCAQVTETQQPKLAEWLKGR